MKTLPHRMDLSGRTALLTGATGNLGQTFANVLAELGAELVLVDHPKADPTLLARKISNDWGVKATGYKCDFENEKDRVGLLEWVTKTQEELSILVNNAAIAGHSDLEGFNSGLEDQTIDSWRRVFEVNLTAVFDLSKGLAPILRESPGGSIVNIGSIYGVSGPDWRLYEDTIMANPAAYAVSKGGLIQLTRWLATTLAPHVRVNALSPGGIHRNQPDNFVAKYESRTPLGRMAREEDFVGAISFLVSDLSSYITGQNLIIDGGWTTW